MMQKGGFQYHVECYSLLKAQAEDPVTIYQARAAVQAHASGSA